MRMSKNMEAREIIVIEFGSVFAFIKAFIVTLKYRTVNVRLNLTLNNKDFGHINVKVIPKYKFVYVGE